MCALNFLCATCAGSHAERSCSLTDLPVFNHSLLQLAMTDTTRYLSRFRFPGYHLLIFPGLL